MKKISFVIILVFVLGCIMYYYAEKKNISLLQETSDKAQVFAQKTFNKLQEYHPEAKDKVIPRVENAKPASLVGEWVLSSFDLNKVKELTSFAPKKLSDFSLHFDTEGQVSGTTDCNGFFGSYTKEGDSLQFGTLGSTMMYCSDSHETVYHDILSHIDHFELTESGLVLSNAEKGIRLLYTVK